MINEVNMAFRLVWTLIKFRQSTTRYRYQFQMHTPGMHDNEVNDGKKVTDYLQNTQL